jgi:hypothetical protein
LVVTDALPQSIFIYRKEEVYSPSYKVSDEFIQIRDILENTAAGI